MALISRTGKIVWRGETGSSAWDNESLSNVIEHLDAGKIIGFTTAIAPYSGCVLPYFFHVLNYSRGVGAPAAGSNIDKKAVIFFRDPDDLLVKTFQFPDPLAAHIETTPWGKKIKDSSVTAIVGLLSTLALKTYIPLYGVYYQRK